LFTGNWLATNRFSAISLMTSQQILTFSDIGFRLIFLHCNFFVGKLSNPGKNVGVHLYEAAAQLQVRARGRKRKTEAYLGM
jgi:hypothetical protein